MGSVDLRSVRGDRPTAPTFAWPGRPWLAAELGLLVAAGLVCLPLVIGPGHPHNFEHYKYWTRLVTLGGIESAYSGRWPESYAIYPPVPLYFFKAVGHLYGALRDPTFDLEPAMASQELTTAIKLVGVGFHLLTGLAISLLGAHLAGPRAGLVASAAYLLNPAAIYDVAGWGQPDSVHGLFTAVAAGLLALGRPGWAGASFGLALMSKPQAWAVLPVLGAAALWTGPSGAFRFGLAGAAAALAPIVPFVVRGRLGEFLTLPREIAAALPVVTANAHNLWWVVTRGQDSPWVRDEELFLGPLTYRQAALPLVLGAAAFAVWRLGPARPGWRIPLAAAYLAFAWFMLTTQAHDNHTFFVLPLLALALHRHPALRVMYAALTATLFLDIFLHDPLKWDFIVQTIGAGGRWWVSEANAVANLALLAYFTRWLVRLTNGEDARRSVLASHHSAQA